MKPHLLIALLFMSWTAQAQFITPSHRGRSLRLDGSMGLSERNDTARDSMVVDSLRRHLTGSTRGGRLAASAALTDVSAASFICFSGNYANLTNKPVLFSGNYAELTYRPTILTSVSGLVNDADYRTGAQAQTAIRAGTDTFSASLLETTSAIRSVSATATQALALAQPNTGGRTTSAAGSPYTIQYRATNVNTASGSNQTLTHNFGPNTGIDRIVAYEVNTRVSVDMPFDTGSVTDTQVTIQPLATTTYTAIIVIGHKLQ